MPTTRYVAAVRLGGGSKEEHITELIYVTPECRGFKASRSTVISKIETEGFVFKVNDGDEVADVEVVNGQTGKYLRSKKDGTRKDNLLNLPRY